MKSFNRDKFSMTFVQIHFPNRSSVHKTHRAPCLFFYREILFTDEGHFCLNGYVNKQNCRVWSETNSRQYRETRLHPLKSTFWCRVHSIDVTSRYFFRNEEVNGEWRAISAHAQYIFIYKNAGVKHRHLIVPTRWCYMPHSHRTNQFIEKAI